jgi:hypothetical protein
MFGARIYMLVTTAILAGCATQAGKGGTADKASANGSDMQCQSKAVTGSMFSKTVCSTKAQRDASRAAAEELKEEAGTHDNVCRSPTGQC